MAAVTEYDKKGKEIEVDATGFDVIQENPYQKTEREPKEATIEIERQVDERETQEAAVDTEKQADEREPQEAVVDIERQTDEREPQEAVIDIERQADEREPQESIADVEKDSKETEKVAKEDKELGIRAVAGYTISLDGNEVKTEGAFGRNCLEPPIETTRALNRAYENVITLDEIAAKAQMMNYDLSQYFEKGSNSIFNSPEDLKNALDALGIEYNEELNIIIQDEKYGYTAYFSNENGQEKDDKSNELGNQEIEIRNDKMNDTRNRQLGTMEAGEITTVVNAKGKDSFDQTCNTIEAGNTPIDYYEDYEKTEAECKNISKKSHRRLLFCVNYIS